MIESLGGKPLKSFHLRAASEAGVSFAHQRQISYLENWSIDRTNKTWVRDPEIDAIRVGLTGEIVIRDGEPTLEWELTTLVNLSRETQILQDVGQVPVEVPQIRTRRGTLRLRSAVNLVPIAELTTGEAVVLVVRRAQ